MGMQTDYSEFKSDLKNGKIENSVEKETPIEKVVQNNSAA